MAGRKNVIFIGFTQNGKSSVVQQILKYGGYNEDVVKIGDGSLSETQVCSLYEVTVPIKEHVLVDIESGARIEVSPDTDGRDVRNEEIKGSGNLDLNMIDTPGLSDSSNARENDMRQGSGGEQEPTSSGRRTATVDERHKLSIYKAMVEAGKIHAVCFVVKKSENYGRAFITAVRGFIEVFNLTLAQSLEEMSYYVVHTEINPDDRFSNVLKFRERHFNQFAGIQARHHFMDNLPSRKNSVAGHWAKRSLARFFSDLAEEPGVSFNTIKYPLGVEQQQVNETQLRRVLRIIKASCNTDIAALELLIRRLEIEKADADRRYEQSNPKLQSILAEIKLLDSDEDEFVNRNTCTAVATWTWATESLSVNSKTPISKYEETANGGTWSDLKQSTNVVTGTLTANFWMTATGTISVYSKKRVLHKSSLDDLRQRRDAVSIKVNSASSESSSLASQIGALKSEVTKHKETISNIQSDLKAIANQSATYGVPHCSISRGSETNAYFTVANAYAAALGHDLKCILSKTKLSQEMNMAERLKVLNHLREGKLENEEVLRTTKMSVALIEEEIALKENLLAPLEAMLKDAVDLKETLNRRMDGLVALKPSFAVSWDDLKRIKEIKKAAQAQASEMEGISLEPMDEELSWLEEQQDVLFKLFTGIRDIIVKMKRKRDAWVLQIDHLILWNVAADMTGDMVQRSELPISAFVVIMRGMEAGNANPYSELWRDIWDTMRAKKWAVQSKMRFYRATGSSRELTETDA